MTLTEVFSERFKPSNVDNDRDEYKNTVPTLHDRRMSVPPPGIQTALAAAIWRSKSLSSSVRANEKKQCGSSNTSGPTIDNRRMSVPTQMQTAISADKWPARSKSLSSSSEHAKGKKQGENTIASDPTTDASSTNNRRMSVQTRVQMAMSAAKWGSISKSSTKRKEQTYSIPETGQMNKKTSSFVSDEDGVTDTSIKIKTGCHVAKKSQSEDPSSTGNKTRISVQTGTTLATAVKWPTKSKSPSSRRPDYSISLTNNELGYETSVTPLPNGHRHSAPLPSINVQTGTFQAMSAVNWRATSKSPRRRSSELTDIAEIKDDDKPRNSQLLSGKFDNNGNSANIIRIGDEVNTTLKSNFDFRRNSVPANMMNEQMGTLLWESKSKSINMNMMQMLEEQTIVETEPQVPKSVLNKGFSTHFGDILNSFRSPTA